MKNVRQPLADCNLKEINALSWQLQACYALHRGPGGILSQNGTEIFENTTVLRGPFPR